MPREDHAVAALVLAPENRQHVPLPLLRIEEAVDLAGKPPVHLLAPAPLTAIGLGVGDEIANVVAAAKRNGTRLVLAVNEHVVVSNHHAKKLAWQPHFVLQLPPVDVAVGLGILEPQRPTQVRHGRQRHHLDRHGALEVVNVRALGVALALVLLDFFPLFRLAPHVDDVFFRLLLLRRRCTLRCTLRRLQGLVLCTLRFGLLARLLITRTGAFAHLALRVLQARGPFLGRAGLLHQAFAHGVHRLGLLMLWRVQDAVDKPTDRP